MAQLTFNTEMCKGCGLCVEACPKGLIIIDRNSLNAKGYNFASISDMTACTGCAFCARTCPDCVIKVEK